VKTIGAANVEQLSTPKAGEQSRKKKAAGKKIPREAKAYTTPKPTKVLGTNQPGRDGILVRFVNCRPRDEKRCQTFQQTRRKTKKSQLYGRLESKRLGGQTGWYKG